MLNQNPYKDEFNPGVAPNARLKRSVFEHVLASLHRPRVVIVNPEHADVESSLLCMQYKLEGGAIFVDGVKLTEWLNDVKALQVSAGNDASDLADVRQILAARERNAVSFRADIAARDETIASLSSSSRLLADQRDAAIVERDAALKELDTYRGALGIAQHERDRAIESRNELERGLDCLRERYTNMEQHAETQRKGWEDCIEKLAASDGEIGRHMNTIHALRQQYDDRGETLVKMKDERDAASARIENLNKELAGRAESTRREIGKRDANIAMLNDQVADYAGQAEGLKNAQDVLLGERTMILNENTVLKAKLESLQQSRNADVKMLQRAYDNCAHDRDAYQREAAEARHSFKLADRALSARNDTIAAMERLKELTAQEHAGAINVLNGTISRLQVSNENLSRNVTAYAIEACDWKRKFEAANATPQATAELVPGELFARDVTKVTVHKDGSVSIEARNVSMHGDIQVATAQ